MAEKIKRSIIEYTEFHDPYVIESVQIIGGIQKQGYSNHDIDLLICWAISEPDQIKKTLEHIVHFWLKKEGFPLDKLDIYSYVYFGCYNLAFGGWTKKKAVES